jgi:hypothetical protein
MNLLTKDIENELDKQSPQSSQSSSFEETINNITPINTTYEKKYNFLSKEVMVMFLIFSLNFPPILNLVSNYVPFIDNNFIGLIIRSILGGILFMLYNNFSFF